MTKKEFLALMGQYFDEMGIDCDSVVQHFYDEMTQTLRVHVLSEAELDTLAGHCATKCDSCLWAEDCDNAHSDVTDCPDYTESEDW